MVNARFPDRRVAGRLLAERVAPLVSGEATVVLGLPRGGVPVAREIADRLGAPLDVLLVRKLGVPWHPELAFGAVSVGGVIVTDDDVVRKLRISPDAAKEVIERERAELARREQLYLGGRPPVDIRGKCVVVVDDGIATGSTVRAALRAVRALGARRTIVAAPVAAPETVEVLRGEADAVVSLITPTDLVAIGLWYDDFSAVPDEEVLRLLSSSRPDRPDS